MRALQGKVDPIEMTALLKRLWRAAPFATTVLALALAATLVFGVRSALFWVNRYERIAREQPVAAWMTPRYVAHSWDLPRAAVFEALALDWRDGPPRATLAEIAKDRGVSVQVLIDALDVAIAAHRTSDPGPGGQADGGDERSEEQTGGESDGQAQGGRGE